MRPERRKEQPPIDTGDTATSDFYVADDKKHTSVYKKETPDILAAFAAFDSAVFAPEGREIPLKYRELIALAVGIATQCAYCIDAHSKNPVKAGSTEAELAEAAWVATAIRAGGGYPHGRLAFKLSGANGRSAEPEFAGAHQHSL